MYKNMRNLEYERGKKVKKICLTLIMILAILVVNKTVMAKEIQITNAQSNYGTDVKYVQVASNAHFTPDAKINKVSGVIFGVVAYVCYGAALIILLIKGVQFMAAAPEGKAEIKKQMVVTVAGAVMVFTIRTILKIIYNMHLVS